MTAADHHFPLYLLSMDDGDEPKFMQGKQHSADAQARA